MSKTSFVLKQKRGELNLVLNLIININLHFMKRNFIFLLVVLCCSLGYSQRKNNNILNTQAGNGPTGIDYPVNFMITKPMRDYPQSKSGSLTGKVVPKGTMSEKRRKKLEWLNKAGKSTTAVDPLIGNSFKAQHQGRAPIKNFDGISLNVTPPDPSLAVGPNHIVAMENGKWAVYDKNGTMAAGFPKDLIDPLKDGPSAINAGDPVVMYDRAADRWFISQFQLAQTGGRNMFIIGISKTPDPAGEYYIYSYNLAAQNDYPHYGIWGDSYIAAGNFTGNDKIYAFNRTKMLAGDSSAEILKFAPQGITSPGFSGIQPVHSEGAAAVNGPAKIVYYQDDAWSGASSDHIALFNLNLNWANTSASTLSAKQTIPVAAFDGVIEGPGFANLNQKGSSQRIDAILGAVMNMSHWYKFATHQSIVLNWVVEVTDGTRQAGIRWAELRSTDNGTTWSLYQQGTFKDTSGNESVFMGCIGMDKQGNIGLGYTKTGTNTFPSLYYTGRKASTTNLGAMNVNETLVVAGTSSVGADRYGDYGQLVRDPSDDLTFWATSEYSGDPRKCRIYSFKLGTDFTKDVGVSAITTPAGDGTFTAAQAVTVTLKNFGTAAQSNIPVTLKLGGATIATETYTGTIAAGATASFTFTATVNLSTVGQTYTIEACTGLTGDENVNNNCNSKSVKHLMANDMGVVAISAPSSGATLGATETVTITVQNFGASSQSNIPVQYTINGGTAVSGTIAGPVASGATAGYSFTTTANLSNIGSYNICAKTLLVGDQQASNDEFCKNVTKTACQPTGDCTQGDGVSKIKISELDHTSTCGGNGYINSTAKTATLERSTGNNVHNGTAQVGYNGNQFSIWIDFNDNGTFETSERLVSAQTINNANTDAAFTLTIPTTANLGNHIMRVRGWDPSQTAAGQLNNPCDNLTYGRTEDFTVKIVDQTLSLTDNSIEGSEILVAYNNDNTFNISYPTAKNIGSLQLKVYNPVGQLITTTPIQYGARAYEHKLDLSTQSTGLYLVSIEHGTTRKLKKIMVR